MVKKLRVALALQRRSDGLVCPKLPFFEGQPMVHKSCVAVCGANLDAAPYWLRCHGYSKTANGKFRALGWNNALGCADVICSTATANTIENALGQDPFRDFMKGNAARNCG